jgi:hypothetical protein
MEEKRLGGNYIPPQKSVEEIVDEIKAVEDKPKVRSEAHVGGIVIWHDATGGAHKALVTAVWTPTCINVVFVSDDENKQDTYGRQIERATSCPHASVMNVHGFYWRFEDEVPNGYAEALER